MKQIGFLLIAWFFVSTAVAQSEPTFLKANTLVTGRLKGTTVTSVDKSSAFFLINTALGEITTVNEYAKVYRIISTQKKKSATQDYLEYVTVDRNNLGTTFLWLTALENGKQEEVIIMLSDGINYLKYYVTLRKTF